jgi:hypothetical protein
MERKNVNALLVISIAAFLTLMFTCLAGFSSAQSTTLEVEISVADVQNLYGFDFTLRYNSAILDVVDRTPLLPWSPSLILRNEVNEAEGTYRLAAVALAPATPYDGTTKLVTLTFLCTGTGDNALNLAQTALTDSYGYAIPHNVNEMVIQAIPTHDVAVIGIRGSPRGAYQGDPINVQVVVRNKGNFEETFEVTVYADKDEAVIGDEYIVGTKQVSGLAAKTTQTMDFVWDTSNVAYGAYWLSAQATAVEGETLIADNFLKCGDHIGGIYAPPQVRQNANLWINAVSILAVVSLVAFGTFEVKRYWFP